MSEHIKSPVFGKSRIPSDVELGIIERFVEECPVHVFQYLNKILNKKGSCISIIRIDHVKVPDRIVMKCACGWCGEPKDMNQNPIGIRVCPDCGASGGLSLKDNARIMGAKKGEA